MVHHMVLVIKTAALVGNFACTSVFILAFQGFEGMAKAFYLCVLNICNEGDIGEEYVELANSPIKNKHQCKKL